MCPWPIDKAPGFHPGEMGSIPIGHSVSERPFVRASARKRIDAHVVRFPVERFLEITLHSVSERDFVRASARKRIDAHVVRFPVERFLETTLHSVLDSESLKTDRQAQPDLRKLKTKTGLSFNQEDIGLAHRRSGCKSQ